MHVAANWAQTLEGSNAGKKQQEGGGLGNGRRRELGHRRQLRTDGIFPLDGVQVRGIDRRREHADAHLAGLDVGLLAAEELRLHVLLRQEVLGLPALLIEDHDLLGIIGRLAADLRGADLRGSSLFGATFCRAGLSTAPGDEADAALIDTTTRIELAQLDEWEDVVN